MTGDRRDRGEYHAFYVAFLDDPDVQALDHLAFRVLIALRMSLGAAGIGVPVVLQVCQRANCTPAEYEAACRVLEAPKPDDVEGLGWIRRERNIVWVVNALRYHPSLSAENPKHRTFVRERLLRPLGEKAIVRAFWTRYREWQVETGARDTVSIGYPGPIGTEPDHKAGSGSGKREAVAGIRSGSGAPTHARDAAPTTAADADEQPDGARDALDAGDAPADSPLRAAPLAALVARLREQRYRVAPPERWRDVVQQLHGVLAPEGTALRKREVVRATPAILARAIALTLAEPTRNPDRSIVVVLLKCRDGEAVAPRDAQGRTAPEAAAADDRARRAADEQEFAARQRAADAWLAEHAEESEAIAVQVDLQCPSNSALPKALLAHARAACRVQLVERRRAELGELAGVGA
ncbi:hypothetical protein [Roseisolibacter agri]|uniref:Uncharacterized protein n=1 Tax=Roseisolibacter agri TaxID=2014610 RepID=A0AA37Q5L6_9BACT|nr:hypothetical protein [Roseisolibacter agri]GLC25087.1 hypothetical protein rosag_16000 [Roseisolibacter agri]